MSRTHDRPVRPGAAARDEELLGFLEVALYPVQHGADIREPFVIYDVVRAAPVVGRALVAPVDVRRAVGHEYLEPVLKGVLRVVQVGHPPWVVRRVVGLLHRRVVVPAWGRAGGIVPAGAAALEIDNEAIDRAR